MQDNPIIPEFMMYTTGLEASEIEELRNRISQYSRSNRDRFRLFTDILLEYVGSGEWKNRSPAFLAMCAKGSFLRGMYGYNQILAKEQSNLTAKGYAAAAYCRQSLDPRWLNNLRNITNQAWQSKDYIAFAELSGQLASVLIDLGYTDHAREVASESIEKVTQATAKDTSIRNMVQAALLRARIILATIAETAESREEALIRLDSAQDTAKHLDHQLALTDIKFFRSRALEEFYEHDRALSLVTAALRQYERMGYLQGAADARNLRGVIHLNMGRLQEARDQFEELLIIQQRLNNQIGLAATLINVGEIDRTLDQIQQMETYNRRALEISQEAEYVRGIVVATVNLGDVALRKGETEEAIRLYNEGIELSEKAGMRTTLALTLFLAGDANYILQRYDEAITCYRRAKDVSVEIDHLLYVFNADVSELVTILEAEKKPDHKLLSMIRSTLGSIGDWSDSPEFSLMMDVRKKVLDDHTCDSDLCVFFDGEKSFECRVERMGLRKECFGNLYWMGGLCPHFKDFLSKLRE
ncbi:MAG: tetratricopeptide repeat protein [Candidatus Thorarchaeota archaeon SMTZ1-45]